MVDINESQMYEAPGFLGRLRDALFSVLLAALLFQAALFWGLGHLFGTFTIFLLYDNPVLLSFLSLAALLGFWVGRPFYDHLGYLVDKWFIIGR